MYDVDEQSRVLRWSAELKSRLGVREMTNAALPTQRTPVEAPPPPPADR